MNIILLVDQTDYNGMDILKQVLQEKDFIALECGEHTLFLGLVRQPNTTVQGSLCGNTLKLTWGNSSCTFGVNPKSMTVILLSHFGGAHSSQQPAFIGGFTFQGENLTTVGPWCRPDKLADGLYVGSLQSGFIGTICEYFQSCNAKEIAAIASIITQSEGQI